MGDHSFLSLIFDSTLAVQTVFLVLGLSSVYIWAVAIDKLFLFKSVNKRIGIFEADFNSGSSIDNILTYFSKDKIHIPHYSIALSILSECNLRKSENNFLKTHSSKQTALNISNEQFPNLKERVNNCISISLERSISSLYDGIGSLGIVGSLSPFIGLFGTVWGIMDSFKSIANSKNITLATVAPGIAEALLATAIAIFVAIVASYFNSILSLMLEKIESKAKIFSLELWNIVLYDISDSQMINQNSQREKTDI